VTWSRGLIVWICPLDVCLLFLRVVFLMSASAGMVLEVLLFGIDLGGLQPEC